ncbi:MAG: sugar MFS transporter [Opitutaceae bacterium]|nr:sugar MFS transporter [Cytophagales bacterium]
MNKQYTFQIATIGALFFFFGFVTWNNSILVPYLKIACELSNFQSYLVTFAFYVAYFVMAIPSSIILKATGYKNGIVLGLLVCAIGTLLFIPAAMNRFYIMFLSALYILGTGLAILQTAANPYITLLGPPEGASSRINIMGTCSSIAGMAAPLIFGSIALKNADNLQKQASELSGPLKDALLNSLSERVIAPYAILSLILVLLAMMIWFSKLPEIEKETETKVDPSDNLWKHKHLVLGVIAIFAYVGVEVLSIDSLVSYAAYQGYSLENAKNFPSYCVGAMFIGRFLGIFLMGKKISSQNALAFNSLVAILLVLTALFTKGDISIGCIVLLGLCHSIMWSSIFPLAIADLGLYTKRGSSFLIMAIVGGALIPPLYGKVADMLDNDLRASYFIMLPFYLFLLYYGFSGYKVINKKPSTNN